MAHEHQFQMTGFRTVDGVLYKVYKCGCGVEKLIKIAKIKGVE